MAFAVAMKRANVNVEVLIRTLGNDPLVYGVCTVGLWAGGDVLGIDESEQATVSGTLNFWTSTDPNIAGISNQGTRDKRIRDLVALYGKFKLTGEKVGTFRYGKVRVRVANDATAIAVGDILQVAADTQTIEGETTEVCAVADNMAWEALPADVLQADIIALHSDLSQVLGWATKLLDATPGEDKRTPLILMLQPYRLLVSE